MGKDNYLGNILLKGRNVKIEWTEELLEEFVKCKEDPVYFAQNYVHIVDVDKGFVKIDLYDYQEEIIEKVYRSRRIVANCSRQSGKTTTAVVIILHYVIFNKHKTVALLSNKGDSARDILSRIQAAYEALPKWLQQGVLEWNKGSIEFENGCKILAGSTSSSSIRGKSCSFLYIDEAAFVEGFDEFFASVYPTISSGQETKLFLTSTPYGLNHFYEIFTNAKKGMNGYEWIEVPWHRVPGRDEKWKEETLKSINFDYQKFDAEFNIEFLGSAGNLLSKTALEEITNQIEQPIQTNHLGVKQYRMPEKDHVYVCVADVSRGKGLDYSAFQIIDVTSLPYEQVCVFHSNSLVPLDFGTVLHEMVRKYNDALLLIENNDIGAQVADSLYFDYEYEYLVYTQNKGMKGKVISQGFSGGGQTERGIRTTKPVKGAGCSNIKVLIENGKLKIRDYETVHEFYTFIKKGDSWEAEPGRNDDLVMCLVLFGWMSAQQYFEEFTDNSALQAMREKDQQELYDSLTPFGIIWDGRNDQDEHLIQDVDDF